MVPLLNHWGISSEAIVQAAKVRGLEVEIVHRDKNFFTVSDGHVTHYFKNIECGLNTALALKIADDKELSHLMMEEASIPQPKTFFLESEEDLPVLDELTFPVVIKPISEGHGDGVHTDVSEIASARGLLKTMFMEYGRVIVQEQVRGEEVRVLVVGNQVVCCKKREPAHVIGDGSQTIEQLIAQENDNPMRGNYRYGDKPLSPIPMDERVQQFLAKQSLNLSSIPNVGERVDLLGVSNVGSGGVPVDVTDEVCDEIKQICVDVTVHVGLGVAGIDVLSTDFSKPLEKTGGVILEIGATPGIGTDQLILGRDSAGAILDYAFGQ